MKILNKIFSITNEKYHRLITIFGIKIRFLKFSRKDVILMQQNETLNKNIENIMKILLLPENIFSFNKTKVYVPNFPIDLIQHHIVINNQYFEEEVLKELDNYIPEGATILDCGANIGNHTMYWLLSSPKNIKKIHAFEPVKSTFDILNKNVEINNIQDKVVLHNFGLHDKNTNGCIMHYDVENIGGTNIREGNGCIELKRLDDIGIQEESIDFMKIDVEGSEVNLLNGGVDLINKYKPTIFIESFPEHYEQVKTFMKNNGYKLIKEYEGYNYLYKYDNKIVL